MVVVIINVNNNNNFNKNTESNVIIISIITKIVLFIILITIIIHLSCQQKQNIITLKYAYITRQNIEYSNKHHKVISTHIIT